MSFFYRLNAVLLGSVFLQEDLGLVQIRNAKMTSFYTCFCLFDFLEECGKNLFLLLLVIPVVGDVSICSPKKNKKDYPCDLCAADPFVTLILAINTIVPAVTNKKNKNGNSGSALLILLLPWWGHGGAESVPAVFQQEAAHHPKYTRSFSFT